jgi:hypothetical protein
MKTLTKSVFSIGMLGILSMFTLRAQTTTVLDGFEENTPGMPPGTTTNGFSPGRCTFLVGKAAGPTGTNFCNTNIAFFSAYQPQRAPANTMAQYAATGPNDPFVTEGTHSMGITFYEQGFAASDFQIVLSDTNSVLVEQAAASGQIGRYILRFDVIFSNPSQYTFFNMNVYIGNDQDYLSIAGATPASTNSAVGVYSCALELPALGLPAPNSGTNVEFYIANNFSTTQSPFTNCTIYIDNIRLVDTYASASTVPVIYPLISFKNGIGAATNLYPTVTNYYGNPVTARTHLYLYTTNGLYNPATNGIPDVCTASNQLAFFIWNVSPYDTDFAVTESDGCALMVSNVNSGTMFQADFAISFAGTKLAQILTNNYPLSQLAHYTLRWDTTMPEVWALNDGTYINFVYTTGLASLPMCQGRRESLMQDGLQRLTYSVTLDQIAAWGGSPVGGDPAIIFLSDAVSLGAGPMYYYFDNFELIDTAPPVVAPTITSYNYNPMTQQFTLTWTSQTGGSYTVQSSASLQSSFSSLAINVPSGGSTTTTTVTMPGGKMGYLRILVQ